MGLIKNVIRAAVAQPWDYQGDGAPGDWEFRVSPDDRHHACFDPARGTWRIHSASTGEVVAEVRSLDEMNEHTRDWRQFVSVEDPDD
jgi:hypothetical protein